MGKNYYEVLQISNTANDDEIKKAYKKLALKYHPDKNMGDPVTQKIAGEEFKLVNSAFHVLSNKEAREVYDKHGEEGLQGLANSNKSPKPKNSGESVPGSQNDVNFTFQTAREETCFEERGEQDGVSYIYTGGTITTQSRFTFTYTGDEDPMETFARVFGTADIFSLLLNIKDDEDGSSLGSGAAQIRNGQNQIPMPQLKVENCSKCDLPILGGSSVLFEERHFHDACFKCENCSGRLPSVYTVEGKHYCEACHVELFAKKCDSCSKPLKGECTVFRDKNYHRDCLCCSECKKPFEKMSVMSKDDKLFCEICYGEKHGSTCAVCSTLISPVKDDGGVKFNGKSYHGACFVCLKCKTGYPTVKPVFTLEKTSEDHYCCECYDSLFSEKCTACKKVISDANGCIGSGDQQWHRACLKCSRCEKSLIGQKVTIEGDELLCSSKCNT